MATPRIRVTGRSPVLGRGRGRARDRDRERDRDRREPAGSFYDRLHVQVSQTHWQGLLDCCLELDSTLRRVAEIAITELADLCAVILVEDGAAKVVASAEADPGLRPLVEEIYRRLPGELDPSGDLGRAIRLGERALYPNISDAALAAVVRDEEQLALLRELRLVSALLVPLRARGAVLGSLLLLSTHASRRHRPADLARAERLASCAAVAIDNASEVAATRRALAAREELVSVLAHELKSPLSTVDLSLQVLAAGGRNERERATAAIRRQVGRMRHLVDNLLDATRIASDHLALVVAPGDLVELVRDAAERLREECTRAGCELRFEHSGPIQGQWDPLRIDQVITNLIGNAMKYGAGRPIEVVIERAGSSARVVVRDSGPGIPKGDIDRVFEPFERGERDLKQAPGVGLGLWIVRRSVEAMGGKVRAVSAPGQGAEMIVELPIASS